jgi:hypothetical protein
VSPPNDSPTSTLSASTTTWSGSQRRWLGWYRWLNLQAIIIGIWWQLTMARGDYI